MINKISSVSDIIDLFLNSAVEKKDLMLGVEIEKSGIYSKNLKPVNYLDNGGYGDILKKLVSEVGWKIVEQDCDGNIFALKRGGSFVYIEGDGRLELATSPRKNLFELEREYKIHKKEIDEISKYFGVRWISMGWQPFAKVEDIKFSPKPRSKIFSYFFKNMSDINSKKNNAIHINFGYTSEKLAIKKFQTMYKIAPIITGMFACSPFDKSKFSGFFCNRLYYAQNFDLDRNGVKKIFFDKNFSFEKWVKYIISKRLFYIVRKVDGKKTDILLDDVNITFEDFLKNGYSKNNSKKFRANENDFWLHLKSVWNEVRIKQYIEFRTIDCVPPHLVKSTLAVIKGIAFDSESLDCAFDLLKNISFDDYCKLRDDVNKNALQAEYNGIKVLDFAKELLNIASDGFKKILKKYPSHPDESRFLWPIKEYIFVREQSPAEAVMEMWENEWHKNPRKLLRWSES